MSILLTVLALALGSVTLGTGSSDSGPVLDPSAPVVRQLPIELITSTGERAYATPTGGAKPLLVGSKTTVRILYRGSARSTRLVSLAHRGSSQPVARASLRYGHAGWRLPAVKPGPYTLAVSVASLHGLFSLLVGNVRPGVGSG